MVHGCPGWLLVIMVERVCWAFKSGCGGVCKWSKWHIIGGEWGLRLDCLGVAQVCGSDLLTALM